MGAAEQAAIIEQYQRQTQRVREGLLRIVRQLLGSLDAYREEDARQWVEQIVPRVVGAQESMVDLTVGYLRELIADMTGEDTAMPEVAPPDELRGVPPDEVYMRPFHAIWRSLSRGESLDEAVDAGLRRAESLAATDVQLAKTTTTQQVISEHRRTVGWRRVPKGAFTCALCLIASTQRYTKSELAAIHPGCDCDVAPIVGDQDPGQVIDEELLEATHDAVETAFGAQAVDRGGHEPDYRGLIVTREHGEYGPTLAVAGHEFTGSADLSAG